MKRILVVDDDKSILEMLEDMLALNNFEVMTVNSGRDIAALLKAFKPDLVLLDVMLGNEDGREICKTIKQNIATKSLPVILMSAFDGNKQDSVPFGSDSFIAKPFDIHVLVGEINRLAVAS